MPNLCTLFFRSCEHDLSDFDPYLNRKHLCETLSLVITLYQESDRERKEVKSRSICTGEDASSFTQCDVCDKSSDESSRSSDSDSDDVNECKITQDAVASEKKESAGSRDESESEGSSTNLSRNATEQEVGERSGGYEESSSSPTSSNVPCNNTTTTPSEGEEKDEEQDRQKEREEEQRRAKETDTEECQKREKKWEKLKCDMQMYTQREEAEALNLLVNFGQEEVIMHILKLPREIRYTVFLTFLNLLLIMLSYKTTLVLSISLSNKTSG